MTCLYKKQWFMNLSVFFVGFLIGIAASNYVDHIKQEGYNSGYFDGSHESRFLDCSKPIVDRTMEIVFYTDEVFTHYEYFELKYLCSLLSPKLRVERDWSDFKTLDPINIETPDLANGLKLIFYYENSSEIESFLINDWDVSQ